MKIAVLIARILLGLVFFVFGLNNLHTFMPMQTLPGDAGTLTTIMIMHGWITFHAILYVIAGVLLLVGRYVPVALVILGPILVNIILFHLTLMPAGIAPGLVCALLEVFLIYAYWPAFRGIFTSKMEVGEAG
jgi:putative oxidoreductase